MQEEPKKDKECIQCDRFFECKGKPPEVKYCINFRERKNGNGRKKNVCKNNN